MKKKKKQNIKSKGFTLIELLATLAILSLVTTIVIYFAGGVISDTKEKSYQVTINNIEKNAGSYVLESIPYLTWIKFEDKEYQCVTIENLIEKGYFKNDILSSKISKNQNVQLSDTVYVERDSNKTINKSYLLSVAGEEYDGMCLKGSSSGTISTTSSPKGWAKEKEITIYFDLFDNIDKTSNYKYEYKFEDLEYSENLSNRSIEKKIKVNKNGNLLAYIYDGENNVIASHTRYIDKVDTEGPYIISNYNGIETVRNTVTIPLELKDNGSGVNYSTFGLNDMEIKIGSKIIKNGITKEEITEGKYEIKIDNVKDAGIVTIKISSGKISDNIGNENTEIVLTPNITFDNTYTISYRGNDGTGSMTDTVCTYGQNCTVEANGFKRTGYTFQGWTTNSDGADDKHNWTNWSGIWQYVDDEYGIKDGKVILYARWQANTYTVTYNGNGNTGGSTSKSTHTYDTAKTLTANGFSKTGYSFAGWATSATGNVVYTNSQSVKNLATSGNVNLYAKWIAETYTISYDLAGGSVSTANKTSYTIETNTFTLNNPTRTGYTFAGWTGSNGTTKQTGVSIAKGSTGDKSYTANWTANNYYIDLNGYLDSSVVYNITNYGTADIYVNGILVAEDASDFYQQYPYGSSYEIKDIKAAGGKKYNGVHSGSLKGTVGTSGVSVYLSYSTSAYTINYDANGGSGAPSAQTKNHGVALTLSDTKPTRSGYTFLGWSTSSTTTSATYTAGGSYGVDSGATLYAVWKNNTCKHNYTYSYNSSTKFMTISTLEDIKDDNYDDVHKYRKQYYFKNASTTCYKGKGTGTGSAHTFKWCDDWMNGENKDNDPNYVAVFLVDGDWAFSVSYCCYVQRKKLTTKISANNEKACPTE